MISFQNQSISFKLKDKTKLKLWIKSIVNKEKHVIGTLNYIFCSDDELLEINIKHLNHNTFTDIITFDYTEAKKISSDIFISIDRVIENSKKCNTPCIMTRCSSFSKDVSNFLEFSITLSMLIKMSLLIFLASV